MRSYLTIKYIKDLIMNLDNQQLLEFMQYVKDKVSENIYNDVFIPFQKGMLNGWDHTNLYPPNGELRVIGKYIRKWRDGEQAVWITISPDHLKNPLKYSKLNCKRISEFAIRWFSLKRYHFYSYVIESGENKDDPHIHIHALVQIRKAFRDNHARDLKKFWEKRVFHTLKGKDYFSKNVSGIYRNDKLQYMENCAKGSHENFCDDIFELLDIEGTATKTRGELI